jgi:hypothetical protein
MVCSFVNPDPKADEIELDQHYPQSFLFLLFFPCLSVPIAQSFHKGSLKRDFCLQVFFVNPFPQAPAYPIGAVSNFYENS